MEAKSTQQSNLVLWIQAFSKFTSIAVLKLLF